MPRCAICCAKRNPAAASGATLSRTRPSGYVVLALGKMGAFELNYSSDIDLMVFYDPAAAPADVEPGAHFVRMTRGLVKLLQERTADGYVFRVDLRLRPDPGVDADRGVDPRGARLLRTQRPELGTLGHDQGAALRRRHRRRRGVSQKSVAVRLAQKSRLRRARRRSRHEAANPCLSWPRRDRDRRPQHQARPRRHPRNRVFRPDPATDRRRPPS